MSILITTSIYPPEIGGLATYSSQFKRRVPGTEVVTLIDEKPSQKEDGVYYIPRKNHLFRQMRLFLSILRHARGKKTIYALNFGTVGLPSMIVAKLLRKRFVVRYAGDSAWERAFRHGKTKKTLESFLEEPDANKRLLKLQHKVISNADAVITPGKHLAHLLKKHYAVDAFVVPNSVSQEDICYNPERTTNAILTVGRLVSYKRIDKIIEALPNSFCKLIVVGDGEELENLKRASVGFNVHFTGRLSHRDLLYLMSSCDFLVLYSLYEGMSHIILESMSAGLPVIATDYPANRELITTGVNGLLVNSDNELKFAIKALLENPEHRKMLADKAKKTVEAHTWEAVLPKTLEILCESQ